ncbi:MAG: GxxExxY protein [Roseivirga sp.]
MQHKELTHRIIGCAMTVHNALGSGFQEVIYQRALAIEMEKNGLGYQREMEMDIFYDSQQIGTRRVDFFVEDTIMLELKALSKLDDSHLAQAMNYCQAYGLPIGLLINFGAKSLQFKRVYNLNHPENKDYQSPSQTAKPSDNHKGFNPIIHKSKKS